MGQRRNEREITDLTEVENTKYQKLWDVAKIPFNGKFI